MYINIMGQVCSYQKINLKRISDKENREKKNNHIDDCRGFSRMCYDNRRICNEKRFFSKRKRSKGRNYRCIAFAAFNCQA